MAFFWYQAFAKTGEKISGTLEAQSIQNAREQLSLKGLYPVSLILQAVTYEPEGFLARIFQKTVSLKDKIFFTKQLGVLLKSGIPLADALNLMIEQTPPYMKPMIIRMRDELKEGTSFTQILSYYPKSFPPLYVQLIKAGEATGQMEKVLFRLASFLEEEDQFNRAVNSAVRGPLIQLGMVFVIAGFLLTLIVPKIADVFLSMGGKKLPMLTEVVLAISSGLLNYYHIIAIACSVIFLGYTAWSQSKSGKLIIDKIKLKIPLIKYFTRKTAVIQFTQTLGLLLESGVDIAQALDIVVQIVENQVLVDALVKAKENIIKQGRVTEYLQKTELFDKVAIHLINTGEQSGALDVMLIQVGKYNQDELSEFSAGLTALLNPLSMAMLAVVVGIIIGAVMGPLMDMANMMNG